MPLEKDQIASLTLRLQTARLEAREIEPLAQETGEISIADAYEIQTRGMQLRLQSGEKIIGYKMGLTSKAKREQMKLDSPVYGVLTDRMRIPNGATHSLHGGIHPKIEPEIAFLLKKDLKGKVSRSQVLEACSGVCGALEILDSRYKGFQYFSLPDVIADNSSSSHFVVGEVLMDFRKLNLSTLTLSMRINGKIVQSALGSVISGDPVLSVVQLCELLAARGEYVPAGSFVLAGAATPAVALEPGMIVDLDCPPLPDVSVRIQG